MYITQCFPQKEIATGCQGVQVIHCHLFYCILMFFMKEKMLGCIEYCYFAVLHNWQKSFQHHNDYSAPILNLLLEKQWVVYPVPDILGETLYICIYVCTHVCASYKHTPFRGYFSRDTFFMDAKNSDYLW